MIQLVHQQQISRCITTLLNRLWKKIGSLSSTRSLAAIAVPSVNTLQCLTGKVDNNNNNTAVSDNAIIIIGGYTKGDTLDNVLSSSLTVVELGQTPAELLHFNF